MLEVRAPAIAATQPKPYPTMQYRMDTEYTKDRMKSYPEFLLPYSVSCIAW